jgi:hypothetical protein
VTGSAGATESSWSVVWIRGACPFSARVLVLFVMRLLELVSVSLLNGMER